MIVSSSETFQSIHQNLDRFRAQSYALNIFKLIKKKNQLIAIVIQIMSNKMWNSLDYALGHKVPPSHSLEKK